MFVLISEIVQAANKAMSKAVATDFEVVRPGSGCGLFDMGVVCFM